MRPVGREDEPPAVIARPETAAVLREAVEALVLMLSPFTPHLAEELWERLGHTSGVVAAGWPAFDEAAAREDEIEMPVQVNGKVRGAHPRCRQDASEAEMEAAARAAPPVAPHLAERRGREGRRRQRPSREHRRQTSEGDVMMHRWISLVAGRLRGGRGSGGVVVRLRAGGPRQRAAGGHHDHRRAALREPVVGAGDRPRH